MEVDIYQVIAIVGALAGIGGSGLYVAGKKRLRAITKFLSAVDDALYDDKISEEEFRRIWEAGKGLKDAL